MLSTSGDGWKNRLTDNPSSVFGSTAKTRTNWRYRTSKFVSKKIPQRTLYDLQMKTLETTNKKLIDKMHETVTSCKDLAEEIK